MPTTLRAGEPFPEIAWRTANGESLELAKVRGWRMLIVYRGKHCGMCKKYLAELDAMLDEYRTAEVFVAAVSADPEERARAQVREGRLRFPVGYGLTVAEMRRLGLYVSPSDQGTTGEPFAEPAVFVVNPDNDTHVVNVSNAPFARPGLREMLEGIKTARKDRAPVHGTH